MPVMTAAPLKVSRKQRAELERMAVSTSLPHRVVVQSSALLLAADGEANAVIARACSTTPDTVRRWRAKFEQGGVEAVGTIAPGRGRKPEIAQETIDAIAQKRAEVAGAQAVARTGGVEDLSYTQILAAKITGGADQVAAGEGATRAAKEMGPEKLDALASRLDALIAAYSKTQRVHVENAADLRGPAPGPTPTPGSTGVH